MLDPRARRHEGHVVRRVGHAAGAHQRGDRDFAGARGAGGEGEEGGVITIVLNTEVLAT